MTEDEFQKDMREGGVPEGDERRFEDVVEGFGEDKKIELDESDLPEASPEHVADDKIFSERDFKVSQKTRKGTQSRPKRSHGHAQDTHGKPERQQIYLQDLKTQHQPHSMSRLDDAPCLAKSM